MGGPTASVLTPNALSRSDLDAIRELIRAVDHIDTAAAPPLHEFWVRDSRSLGGSYRGPGRPFAIDRAGPEAGNEDEPLLMDVVSGEFGFTPQDQLIVNAFCNRAQDHRILGELCLHLIGLFGGVVDFAGALSPELPPGSGIDPVFGEWSELEPHFDRMVAGLPGRVVGSPWESDSGDLWVSHIADSTFLRAWLDHPRFYMVK